MIQCLKRNHKWTPRKIEGQPLACPACKQYGYDKPKKVEE